MFSEMKKFFYRKQFTSLFNKKWKLQFSAFYLSKRFCLEYGHYKNPSKEYCQSINYALQQTILRSTLIGY